MVAVWPNFADGQVTERAVRACSRGSLGWIKDILSEFDLYEKYDLLASTSSDVQGWMNGSHIFLTSKRFRARQTNPPDLASFGQEKNFELSCEEGSALCRIVCKFENWLSDSGARPAGGSLRLRSLFTTSFGLSLEK
jgi:hypothetical protein